MNKGDNEVSDVVLSAPEITPRDKDSTDLRSLFEHTSQGYCVFEVLYQGSEAVDARFLEANAAFERHSGLQGVVGRTLSQVVPTAEAEYVQSYAWVAETGRPMHFERGALALGRVFEVEIVRVGDPEQRRVALLFTDVTARKEAQETLRLANERNAFQLRLSDALRVVADPFEVQLVATRVVQAQLGADRVYYAEVSPDAQHVTVAFDEGMLEPRVVGRHHMDSFGPTLMNEVRAGRTLLVEDAATDARLEPQEREAHFALGVRATLAYPLFKAGRLAALLVGHSGSARQWTTEETLLLADTAERTWEALERARSAVALEASNARQAFAVRLSDALRPLSDPLEIQRTAMRVLGEHLQADRVLYAEIETDDRHFVIADNYVRGNVAKMVGRFPLSDYSNAQQSQRRGETFVLPDIRSAGESEEHAAFLAIGVQAIIGVPLHKDGRWVTSLSVHQGSPRPWSPEETAFVSETAERTWAAVERARSEAALRAAVEVQQRLVLELEGSNARQAFLLRLSEALRGLDSAEEIQLTAARLLSEHLGASGAGYAHDLGDGVNVEITSDYSASGVASLRGHYRYEDYGFARLVEFRAGRTVIRPDIANNLNLSIQERDAHAQLGIGASLNVPMLKNGRLMAIFFVNHPTAHAWTPEEVTLAVQTAERTWEAAQRARAEAELRASNERFTRIVEDAPIPILLQAEDGEVLGVNRAWTALTGYTHSETPTLEAWLTHANGHGGEALRDRIQALFAGQVGIVDAELGILTRAGERRTWLVNASSPAHLVDNQRFAVAIATDITERKASEQRLQRNAETFSNLVQGAPFGVYVIDADFRVVQISAGALPVVAGISPLLGRDHGEVLRIIWPEAFASEIISIFRHTLATGEPYTAASTERREDRQSVESYDWRIQRITLTDGSYGVVCYFHDVTVERAATRRLEEVNEAQRRFVSDAAHELRAPLTSIRGNLSLLRRYPDVADEERTEMLGDAEREATRLTRLIADLLAVARGEAREQIELEHVALEQSLEAAWRTARSLSERRRFDLGTLKPMVVLGDPDALQQLFLILLENAVKYSPEDGVVLLEASESEGWTEVRVYNDGAGIASDDLERVFERFYRTDRARSRSGGAMGTGLGLTIARQIVERHGGRVWFESAEGQGTTAIVRLPRRASD